MTTIDPRIHPITRGTRRRGAFQAIRLALPAAFFLLAIALFSVEHSLARSVIQVETISNPAGVRITVEPTSRSGWSLLDVIDIKNGACLKTIHVGRVTAGEHFAVVTSELLPAGPYRLRYRENLELTLAGEIKRPDPAIPHWMNPVDVALAGPSAYIFDSGEEVADKVPALAAERTSKQPYIFKVDRDGKPDAAFGDHGRMALPNLYRIRSFAVDPASGKLFVATGGHALRVYEANGTPTKQTIGGWDNNPRGPVCTPWVDSLCLGWKDRIYIASPSYSVGKTYDRTKEGFAGAIYTFKVADVNGLQRMICSDRQGNVYYVGHSNRVSKFADKDNALAAGYQSAADAKLASPTGGCASAGLVFWACHGPGFGPFWDSGGGGEVVLFWDSGKELKLIDRFGVPGTEADRMQFLNPSAVAINAAHDEVWVTEDGLANTEGPKGNARVRRFALKPRRSETVDFELPK